MNRKFLENLFSSIEDEDTKKNYVNAIMQEHGKDIEKKNTEIGTLKNDITVKEGVINNLNAKVSDFEKQDIEAIKKEQYDLGKADGSKEVETFKKNSALEKALEKSKAKDSKILEKLIDKEKLSYEEKDGLFTITGLDEQIEKTVQTLDKIRNSAKSAKNFAFGIEFLIVDKFIKETSRRKRLRNILRDNMRLMEEYGQERYDEGYEKGIKKGYAEGANNEKWKIARSLLARNVPPEDIAVSTKLTIDEIKQLHR